MRRVFRVLSVLMAGLFVFAAVLQYNDPDPLRWMAIYLSAAVASILHFLDRLRWYLPGIIGLIALAWSITLASGVWGLIGLSQMFQAWEMANSTVEKSREMYGLLIVAFWMAVLVIATIKRRSSPSPHPANG